MGKRFASALVVVAVAATACGNVATTARGALSASRVPLPAGTEPSPIAKMVCGTETQQKITAALSVTATIETPTWTDHLYSCRYTYPNGSFTLSVKELSSWSQTLSYFGQLARTLGRDRTVRDLGQGAFQTKDGSVVVRKDWKVLVVDISDLPARIGVTSIPAGYAALSVAFVILDCWDGD